VIKELSPVIAVVAVVLASSTGTTSRAEGLKSVEAQGPRKERVTFAAGASSATIKGQIKGDAGIDYVVRASAGQTLTVSLSPSNRSNYFNVLPPGSNDVAMYVAQDGQSYSGMLPADGDYTIRVYLIRAAARRNETSTFTLTVGVTGKPLPARPGSQDAKLPGTPYHASTSLPCLTSPYGDAKPTTCTAYVIRRTAMGAATVEIDMGQGMKRRILFVDGKPVATDSSQKFTVSEAKGIFTVKFENGEFYEIVDSLVFGG
jgi:hypothetical protein